MEGKKNEVFIQDSKYVLAGHVRQPHSLGKSAVPSCQAVPEKERQTEGTMGHGSVGWTWDLTSERSASGCPAASHCHPPSLRGSVQSRPPGAPGERIHITQHAHAVAATPAHTPAVQRPARRTKEAMQGEATCLAELRGKALALGPQP